MAANYYKTNMDKIKRTITKIANERVKKSSDDIRANYPKNITQKEYERMYNESMINVGPNPINKRFYINQDFYAISHHSRQYAKYSKRINFNKFPEIYDNLHLASISSFVFRDDDDTPYYDDYIKINFASPYTTINEFKNNLLKNKFDWTFIPYIINPKLYKYNDSENMTLSTAHVRGPDIELAKNLIDEVNQFMFNKTGERMFYNVYNE